MQYEIISHGYAAYQESLELRQRMLREPLGMDLFDELSDDLSTEDRYYHFGALEDQHVRASVMAIPLSPHEIRIKQMVVAHDIQGQGFGKRLFMAFEAYLLNLGFTRFILHARKSAHGFYLNMGYKIIGGEFEEVGLPHYKMSKDFHI